MNNSFLTDFLMISSPLALTFLAILLILFALMFLLKKKHVNFSIRTIIGTVIGIILGVVIQIVAKTPDNPLDIVWINETTKWYSLFGNGFIDLIRMIVIPLIVVSIIHVIISIKNSSNMKELTSKTIFAYIINVLIASTIGIIVANLFRLGLSGNATNVTAEIKEVKNFVDILRNLIPKNPVEAMVNTNIIAVVIFSAFVGVAAKKMSSIYKSQINSFISLIDALHKIIISIAMSIISLIPYAVIPLMANSIAQRGLKSILDVLTFIIALYVGMIIMFGVHLLALSLFGFNPIIYLKKAIAPLFLGFTSRSSLGTLPVAVETLTTSMGATDSTSAFVMGLGTTAGQAGCAGVFGAMVVINVANMSGTPLNFAFYLMTIIVVTVSSFGIAGIPGGGHTVASSVLSGIGLTPFFEYVGPILAVDPILDMGRTCLNINGGLTISLIVDKLLKQINMDKFNDKNLKLDS
ncbi:cation:dicarboxylate symporter family transporter [Candidatus Arthromitus sp. SFB-turkey]|uniref:cation:dicarboxylate symporter family transporter n=1 Tax=Candidatus Arthromitus sp. SFB-turkey TaxID=1840217 RepID=UPI0007F38FA1|nr:cation:dicarboxylase symporter family transporter [Candidatus Arthromitus sp. SFB-turkey]OAT89168.1 sodium:dicarboxylate symporter [Candidatus Arthromitus sp. SFB-turkey]